MALNREIASSLERCLQTPPLPKEKELELAMEYIQTNNPKIRDKLISSNLRRVYYLAHKEAKILGAYNLFDDIFQAGTIGLMKAIEKFNPEIGVRIVTYAHFSIRLEMQRYIRRNRKCVALGETRANRLLFDNPTFRKKLSEADTPEKFEQLAANHGISTESLTQAIPSYSLKDRYLDETVQNMNMQTKTTYKDNLKAKGSYDTLELIEKRNKEEYVRRVVKNAVSSYIQDRLAKTKDSMKRRKLAIITDRLVTEEPKNLEDLGKEFSVTRERIRQAEEEITAYLKKHIKGHINLEEFQTVLAT